MQENGCQRVMNVVNEAKLQVRDTGNFSKPIQERSIGQFRLYANLASTRKYVPFSTFLNSLELKIAFSSQLPAAQSTSSKTIGSWPLGRKLKLSPLGVCSSNGNCGHSWLDGANMPCRLANALIRVRLKSLEKNDGNYGMINYGSEEKENLVR